MLTVSLRSVPRTYSHSGGPGLVSTSPEQRRREAATTTENTTETTSQNPPALQLPFGVRLSMRREEIGTRGEMGTRGDK
jgi:hypothetical protein